MTGTRSAMPPCPEWRADLDYGDHELVDGRPVIAEGPRAMSCHTASLLAGPDFATQTRRGPMPLITVHMYEGRTIEQKRELVASITDVVVKIAKTTPEATQVIIQDVPRQNWASAGKLASDS
jgi:4-oxalocrotonate tautomerase